MAELQITRIDKWLWAVRVFKSRTLATEACRAGKVKVEGKSVKASFQVYPRLTVQAKKGQQIYIYEVVKIINKRVGATLASQCYINHSPPPPAPIKVDKLSSAFFDFPVAQRKRGEGRPTKKDRRQIDRLRDLQ